MNDPVISSSLADIPRIYTAVAEWGACLVFVLIIARRAWWSLTAPILAAGLAALLAVQIWAGSLPLALWIPSMLAAALVMYATVYATLRVDAVTAGYLTARAFVLAELVASAHWQLDQFYLSEAPWGVEIAVWIACYVFALGCAWAAERRHLPRDEAFAVGPGELVSALAIATATFAISNLSFVAADTAFSGRQGTEIFYIRTLVDLCGYIALYVQHEVRRGMQSRRDAEGMAQLLTSQHDQYEISRRAIDEVNRKYHDMKHHLDAIRAEADPTQRMRLLDDLEESIHDYGSRVRTGNPVLDAILAAKHMQAREHGIHVTAVADGSLLAGVRPLDVTALVGNALDNAFEGARRLDDPDARFVRFSLFAHDDFVMLRVENSFDGVVRRENGRIVSRKPDDGHGYGLRSIEAAAQAYGGSVSTSADDGWFTLRVLIPRQRG